MASRPSPLAVEGGWAAARDQPPDEGPSDARVEECDAPVYTSTEAAYAVDLSTRPPANSRICSPHGPLLSWPRGGHEQRVSSMALGAKTEVASSLRWTYGFLFL